MDRVLYVCVGWESNAIVVVLVAWAVGTHLAWSLSFFLIAMIILMVSKRVSFKSHCNAN